MEYLHGRLEGHVQIVFAISLVLASLQGLEALKDMIENLLEYLRRLLLDLKDKIASSRVDSCTVFRREPSQTLSSGGRLRPSLQSMAELEEISRVQNHFSPRAPSAMRPKTHACNPACMVMLCRLQYCAPLTR